MDIDRTVQRLERQLVSQDGGGHREEEELSYQGDDILPEAAEGMGPGKYHVLITWTFLQLFLQCSLLIKLEKFRRFKIATEAIFGLNCH